MSDLDLDQLSNEIAATSPGWLIPGVEAIADGRIARAIGPERDGFWLFCDAVVFRVEVRLCRPNLRDPVTVNSLLGPHGQVHTSIDGVWWARVDGSGIWRGAFTKPEAICCAWIAAKGKKA